MTRERVLSMSLEESVDAFQVIKWKFFDEDETAKIVKLDIPRGTDESFVVELKYEDEKERDQIVDALYGADFIRQKKRMSLEW